MAGVYIDSEERGLLLFFFTGTLRGFGENSGHRIDYCYGINCFWTRGKGNFVGEEYIAAVILCT